MSASQTPPASTTGPVPGPGATTGAATEPGGDPSMEDILASIRRILSEDEASPAGTPPAAPPPRPAGGDADDSVLVLDTSMMVPEPALEPTVPDEPAVEPAPVRPATQPAVEPETPTLVAPEAAAAAASSVDSLVRTLAAERTMRVHNGGPTIEEIVRDELRPLLKAWLDANLPPMVERMVRTEIERVVGRAAP
jgi:uncharacterized protein